MTLHETLGRMARDLRTRGYRSVSLAIPAGPVIVSRAVGSSIVHTIYTTEAIGREPWATSHGYAVEWRVVDEATLDEIRRGAT